MLKKLVMRREKGETFSDEEKASAEYRFARKCMVIDGVLMVPSPIPLVELVPYLPKSMRDEVVRVAHGELRGHLRNPRLTTLIASKCTWMTMNKDVKDWLLTCEVCTKWRAGRNFQPQPGAFLATRRMQQLTIDVMQMSTEADGMNCILGIIDTVTRFAWAIPMPDEKAQTQIDALNSHVLLFRIPEMIIADRHPVYTSTTFLNWALQLGIELNLSSGYSSNHVALVNRLHGTLRAMIARANEAPEVNWRVVLPYVVRAYNETAHAATGYPPGELMFSGKMRTVLDGILGLRLATAAQDFEVNLADCDRIYRYAREMAAAKAATRLRELRESFEKKKRTKRQALEVGTEVMRSVEYMKRKDGKDVAQKYYGPYEVTSLEEDGIHCWIKRTNGLGGLQTEPERENMKNLTTTKGNFGVPSYPSGAARDPCPKPKLPLYKVPERHEHQYETRSKVVQEASVPARH